MKSYGRGLLDTSTWGGESPGGQYLPDPHLKTLFVFDQGSDNDVRQGASRGSALLPPYLVRHPGPAPPRVDLGRSAASALPPGPRACTPPATRKFRSALSRVPRSCVGASPRAFLACGRSHAKPKPQNRVNKLSLKFKNQNLKRYQVFQALLFKKSSRKKQATHHLVRRMPSS